MPRFAPSTPDAVEEAVVERVRTIRGRCVVGVDGPDAARPDVVAERVAVRLRTLGRPADVVSMHRWVRPASLRLEYGHRDELSYRTLWFDYDGLRREVVDAVRDHGRWLPALWDEAADRSARARPRDAAVDQVLLIAGPMLRGRGLDLDVTVALTLTERTLMRLASADEHFTVAALMSHGDGGEPADLEVRVDHPDRPAVLVER